MYWISQELRLRKSQPSPEIGSARLNGYRLGPFEDEKLALNFKTKRYFYYHDKAS